VGLIIDEAVGNESGLHRYQPFLALFKAYVSVYPDDNGTRF